MSMKAVIICVDDNQTVLTSLRHQLKRDYSTEFDIETAESGEEALEIFNDLFEGNVDVPLIISDQIMPGMKGDELLSIIFNRSPKTLTIMLTGQADANAVGNAVNKANLYRYISKPWDNTDLNMTVKEAIKSYYQTQKIEEQNKKLELLVIELKKHNENLEELVAERTKEINLQKSIIEQKNNDITDSIKYAQKIQSAMLSPIEHFDEYLSDYFILYYPKDIISGDFYWIDNKDEKIYVTVADCTGHGVPGAFMSMLGTTLLNDILDKPETYTAAQFLGELRTYIMKSLHQKDNGTSKDGMDMSLCIIDTVNKKINFSGAYNPLLRISNNELIEYKADRMPIAYHLNMQPFTDTYLEYKSGDLFYIFSDGFIDQFGGDGQRKFLLKNFKNLLLQISGQSILEQKKSIQDVFFTWKGETEQIDDVSVLGMKL